MDKIAYKLRQIVLAKRLNTTFQKQVKAENPNLSNEEAKKEIITVELEPAEAEPVAEDPTAFLREIFDERRMVLSGGVLSGVMMVIGIGFIVTSLVSLLGGAAS